ncbi:MAG: IPExxxVDY family protein [Vicingaceae bacterium]
MKRVLSVSDEFDFSILGISCHAKDYRLFWEVNQCLGIDLEKNTVKKEDEESEFFVAGAAFYDQEKHLDYLLLQNKTKQGLLVPEHAHLDYFLRLEGPQHDLEIADCRAKLQSLDMVLALVELLPEKLKSRKNLIF